MTYRYICWDGAAPTTAAFAPPTTGTAIKTMLQVATSATNRIQLVSWGYELAAASTSANAIELIETDVAATVTAHVAGGVVPLNPGAPTSSVVLGVAATGYNASGEGTPATSRLFDYDRIAPTASESGKRYNRVWAEWERPIVDVSKFLRVRTTFAGSSATFACWVVWDEQ